jgi:excisionase family DNA binding protein
MDSDNNTKARVILLTVVQAASRLGISPSTIYQLVAARRIEHLRIGNGRGGIRFTNELLAAYLESCRVEPSRPPAIVARGLRHLRVKHA